MGTTPGDSKARETGVLAALAVMNVGIHVAAIGRYGYHRDELYFLDCASHLDFGYVDHPPFLEFLLAPTRWLLGDSLTAIRVPAVLASTAVVLLTARMARELGGGPFAQLLAGLAALLAPVYLVTSGMISVEGINTLFWVLALYLMLLIVKLPTGRRWLTLGAVFGAGLLTKYAMAFLGAGLGVGLLLTRERRLAASRWPWLAALVAFLLFLPNLVWQRAHQWPFVSYAQKIHEHMMQWIPVHFYVLAQVFFIGVAGFALSLAGFFCLLFVPGLRRFRMFALAFAAILILLMVVGSKPYYPAPAYTILLAAGAVGAERLAARPGWRLTKPAAVAALGLAGLILLPYALPVLPVERFLAYSRVVHLDAAFTFETGRKLPLPQHFADMFGWENQVETVARVYRSLGAAERAKTVIYADNYGEAGAVNLFGRKYGLPRAVSGHFNYYYWGPGPDDTKVVITLGETDKSALVRGFGDVQQAALITHPYAIFYENMIPVFVCRNPRLPIQELWHRTKSF